MWLPCWWSRLHFVIPWPVQPHLCRSWSRASGFAERADEVDRTSKYLQKKHWMKHHDKAIKGSTTPSTRVHKNHQTRRPLQIFDQRTNHWKHNQPAKLEIKIWKNWSEWMMRKKKKKTAQLHVVTESWRKQGRGNVDFKAQRLRSLRPPLIRAAWGGFRGKVWKLVWDVFLGFLFSAAFLGYCFFFAERRLLSTLNFLLCFSTNLNVLLSICMLFCFLEGLWDDLKLERLSIKTNDLVQRKDMIWCFSPPPRSEKTPSFALPFPEPEPRFPMAPFRDGQMFRASVKPLRRNLSDQFWDMFFGGWEGYGIQNCVWKDFFVSSDFCCWDWNCFCLKRHQLEDPSCKSLSWLQLKSIHHWWHEYF